jgi:hypothetical protein
MVLATATEAASRTVTHRRRRARRIRRIRTRRSSKLAAGPFQAGLQVTVVAVAAVAGAIFCCCRQRHG